MGREPETCGPDIAFLCPSCGREYGDDLYHGPMPHCPKQICLDCWAIEWSDIQARIAKEGDWSKLDEALWLVAQGFSRGQAAGLIGKSARTLRRWIQNLRKFPHLIPKWLSEKRQKRGYRG